MFLCGTSAFLCHLLQQILRGDNCVLPGPGSYAGHCFLKTGIAMVLRSSPERSAAVLTQELLEGDAMCRDARRIFKKIATDESVSRRIRDEAKLYCKEDGSILAHVFCEAHKLLSYVLTRKKTFRRDYRPPKHEGEQETGVSSGSEDDGMDSEEDTDIGEE